MSVQAEFIYEKVELFLSNLKFSLLPAMDKVRPSVELPIAPDTLAEVVDDAKDFAFSRGLVFKLKEGLPYEYAVTFIPFSLLPSPWPKDQYDVLSNLQKDINLVYYRVSNDFQFLKVRRSKLFHESQCIFQILISMFVM